MSNEPSNKVNKPMPLSTRHAAWILGWALEECALAIIKCEQDITRHKTMVSAFNNQKGVRSHKGLGSALDVDRRDEIVRLDSVLWEYHEVYRFLQGAKAMVGTKSAEEFAAEMAEMMKGRK